MKRRFVLRNAQIAQNAARFILALAANDDVQAPVMEVVVRPYRSKRSLAQNDYYWKLVRDIADFIGEPSVTVMADMLKAEILEPVRVYRTLKGELRKVYPHTSDMTVKELATFCEMIEAFAVRELGFRRMVA